MFNSIAIWSTPLFLFKQQLTVTTTVVSTGTELYININSLYSIFYTNIYVCVCVCMCVGVFFPFILDIKFVGRTSRGHTGGRSHRIFHPPSFWGACLNFSREKDSAFPFPRRP